MTRVCLQGAPVANLPATIDMADEYHKLKVCPPLPLPRAIDTTNRHFITRCHRLRQQFRLVCSLSWRRYVFWPPLALHFISQRMLEAYPVPNTLLTIWSSLPTDKLSVKEPAVALLASILGGFGVVALFCSVGVYV